MSENLAISNTLYSVAGEEKLSLAETLKTFYAEVSLGVDKFNAAYLNASIHVIPGQAVLEKIKNKNLYFKLSTTQFPTPSLFFHTKKSFKHYVQLCLEAVDLLAISNNELDRIYSAVKSAASTGKLPFTIRQWNNEKIVNALKSQMETTFYNGGVTTHPLNAIYPNIGEAMEIIALYNKTVKHLKSRDTEIVKKKVDNLIDMLAILRRKIDAEDVKFSPDEVKTIEMVVERLNGLITLTGSMIIALNELAQVLNLHIAQFKKLS